MLATNGRLKIAIQKNGRITEESVALLKAAGLRFEVPERSLFSSSENFPLDILAIRDDDIPEYVQDGVSDLGIVGANIVLERRSRVEVLERLGFGKCRLALCAPQNSAIREVSALNGKRIATSYPNTLESFLTQRDLNCEIIQIAGSVELAPLLNVADATCDLISTGSTARVNGLIPLATVFESEAVLVAGATARAAAKQRDIEQLLLRIRSCLQARGKKYVMMNAPAEAIGRLKELVPGMKSPTVVPLANPGMVAVHSVVGEEVLWEVIEQVKKAGATDIVVVPIEKIIP